MVDYKRVLLAVPFVNFFANFFITIPDSDVVEKLVNTMGVISGLLLVVLYAVPGTVSIDELEAADARFGFSASFPEGSTDTAYGCWWLFYFPYSASYTLGAYMTLSGFCFSVVVLGGVMVYMHWGFAKAMVEPMPSGTDEERKNKEGAWRVWYWCNSPIIAFMVASLGVGMATFYVAIFVLVTIKWPDYGLLLHTGDFSRSALNKASRVYRPLLLFNCIVPVVIGVIVLVGGAGNYLVYAKVHPSAKQTVPQATQHAYEPRSSGMPTGMFDAPALAIYEPDCTTPHGSTG